MAEFHLSNSGERLIRLSTWWSWLGRLVVFQRELVNMEQLGSLLMLSEVEERGITLPALVWVGSAEEEELLLVGGLPTLRAFRFDVLQMIQFSVL
ncbi:UNVERIFIED_CONTAM: hypothetical protein Sradi_2096300 [Sesamum radiatum]|uniref:Uncharacterized protein n=1 Tax=Sesamum radiatum TaxID=300843 RepID=A0AAW2TIB5_SESRA